VVLNALKLPWQGLAFGLCLYGFGAAQDIGCAVFCFGLLDQELFGFGIKELALGV
jgi:hypothetical protein